MSNLEKALRQTQEMLEQITALRAALDQQAEPVDAVKAAVLNEEVDRAYDLIDRFLRSNLDDDDYSQFQEALDTLIEQQQPEPEQAEPLQGGLTDFGIRAWKMGYDAAKAEQAEPVAEPVQAETVPVRADVLAFLQGSAPLNGAWFGEKPDGERGQFWWRKYLPPAPQQAEPVTEAALKGAFFKGFHSVEHYYGDVENSAEEAWEKFRLQAEPVAIPGAIPMADLAARSRAMPDRADALERARDRLKQAEQPNALRIADALDGMSIDEMTEALADDAAGELRWLYAEYQRLKQAEPVVVQAEPVAESYAVQSAVLIEREACARLCESTTAAWTQHLYNDACMDCAKAIRGQAEPDGASGNPSF